MDKNYIIEEIKPGVFAIDDSKEDSMYLINGTNKSLLIDTCMIEGQIYPVIRELCLDTTELALTHAHVDHMYHADEFETVYLHEQEQIAWNHKLNWFVAISAIGLGMKVKKYNAAKFKSLTEDTVIDLGDHKIKVIHAKGHTPGSCIFVDEKNKLLFTGDAFGSGDSAWMWMPLCSCVSEYRTSMRRLKEKLVQYEDYIFLGGHRKQGIRNSSYPKANPLTLEIVIDMVLLCNKILNNELTPINRQKQFGLTIFEYEYGKARMWIRKNQIK